MPALVRALLPAFALLAAGCAETGWSTFEPASDVARMILVPYSDLLWWTIGIFVVVEATLLFALWRYRRREGDPDVPEQVHGHTFVEIGWTIAPAVVLFFIAIPTIRTIFATQGDPPQRDPLEIVVTGHQWWWEFEYPEMGITTANELHLPRGRTARLTLTSVDVIHSFWVPRMGGKRDLNPGSENTLWFTPDSVGEYHGHCAELCGTSHANMRFRVFVHEPADFAAWADGLAAKAAPDSAGFHAFLISGCAACHAIAGTPAQGRLGPELTGFGDRTTIAAGIYPNEPDLLAGWLRSPDSMKPGALMPDLNLTEERIRELVAFLEGL
ncbi:MAG TPA: cytochrome c oxidase subunit II [Gemmatimonadota bacterium]|nr:cytochrome c oxidase subunit II [Gemmatimonadota bacterium]